MKHWKKRVLALVMSAVMAFGLIPAGALAAGGTGSESAGIRVELNGEPVVFPDAVPEVLNERTFLPMRAVFEALGAQVDYDEQTRMVTAVRGGTTVSMTIGSKEAAVTRDGVSTVLIMDVPVYARNDRTFVPVRFAAQALGCVVGWDGSNQTVILVDAEPLIAAALERNEYTLLERLNTYSARFDEGSWAVDMDVSMAKTFRAETLAETTAQITGVTAGAASQMTMDIRQDTDRNVLAGMLAITAPAQQVPAAGELAVDMDLEVRTDGKTGAVYMLASGQTGNGGLPAGVWLSTDQATLLAQNGLRAEMIQLITSSQGSGISPAAQIAAQTSTLILTDKNTALATVTAVVDAVAELLADGSFTREGLVYTLTIGPADDGTVTVLKLNTNEAGEVVSYEMSMDAPMTPEELGMDTASLAAFAQQGLQVDGGRLSAAMTMDAQNVMTASVKIVVGQLMSTDLTVSARYTQTDEKPVTTLPEGTDAVDYAQWLEQQG